MHWSGARVPVQTVSTVLSRNLKSTTKLLRTTKSEIPIFNLWQIIVGFLLDVSTVTFALSTMKFAVFLASAFAAVQLGSSFIGK
jgi:hypothetical protein